MHYTMGNPRCTHIYTTIEQLGDFVFHGPCGPPSFVCEYRASPPTNEFRLVQHTRRDMRSWHHTLNTLLLLLTLLTDSSAHLQAASGTPLPARVRRDHFIGAAHAAYTSVKRPTLLTFHGLVEDVLGRQPVILHVLIKTKRLLDGSFSVRTVSYTERVSLESE